MDDLIKVELSIEDWKTVIDSLGFMQSDYCSSKAEEEKYENLIKEIEDQINNPVNSPTGNQQDEATKSHIQLIINKFNH